MLSEDIDAESSQPQWPQNVKIPWSSIGTKSRDGLFALVGMLAVMTGFSRSDYNAPLFAFLELIHEFHAAKDIKYFYSMIFYSYTFLHTKFFPKIWVYWMISIDELLQFLVTEHFWLDILFPHFEAKAENGAHKRRTAHFFDG